MNRSIRVERARRARLGEPLPVGAFISRRQFGVAEEWPGAHLDADIAGTGLRIGAVPARVVGHGEEGCAQEHNHKNEKNLFHFYRVLSPGCAGLRQHFIEARCSL